MKAVILGKADAGVSLDTELSQQPEESSSLLRTILKSPESPSHPLSAHPRVLKKAQNAVVKAVLKIGHNPANSSLMKSVRMPEPLIADYDRDYKNLEEIDIKSLTTE